MNHIYEYIIIGLLLLVIIKLVYDSYKLYKKFTRMSLLKKMFKTYKNVFMLEDSETCNSDKSNKGSWNSYSLSSGNGEYSEYESNESNESNQNSTYQETRLTGYPYTDQGYPVNLDKSLKSVLNNNQYTLCENESIYSYKENDNDNNDDYMKSQLNFNDKINGTSKDALDMVDRMNEYTMSGGVKNPTKIQDVYDNLTQSPY